MDTGDDRRIREKFEALLPKPRAREICKVLDTAAHDDSDLQPIRTLYEAATHAGYDTGYQSGYNYGIGRERARRTQQSPDAVAPRTLDTTTYDEAVAAGVTVVMGKQQWVTICKARCASEGWFKSTKAMMVPGCGVLVQVSTHEQGHNAEALCFIPLATLDIDPESQMATLRLEGDRGIG